MKLARLQNNLCPQIEDTRHGISTEKNLLPQNDLFKQNWTFWSQLFDFVWLRKIDQNETSDRESVTWNQCFYAWIYGTWIGRLLYTPLKKQEELEKAVALTWPATIIIVSFNTSGVRKDTGSNICK